MIRRAIPQAVIIVALMATLSGGGCAAQNAVSRGLAPESSLAVLESRTLKSPALLKFIADRSGRTPGPWDAESLAWAGFYYHPALDAARARAAAAETAASAATDLPNPSLGLTLGRNATSGIPSPWINSLQLDLPLETTGRRRNHAARAEHISTAARLNLASVAWQVRGGIHRAWANFFAARGIAGLLREQAALREEALRFEEARLAAGDAASREVTASRLALRASRLASADAARAASEARIRLAEAIGVPDSALEEAVFSNEAYERFPEAPPALETRRQALLNRADLLAALAEYAAAHAALELELAKQFPELRLGPGYAYDQGENKWSLGFTLTLPVFDRNRGPIAEAHARREEAAAAFTMRQASVLADVDRAMAGWRAAMQRRAELSLMTADIARLESTARARFAAGDIPKSELVTALLQTNAAALARHEVMAQIQRAVGDLESALQVPSNLPDAAWRTAPIR